MRRLHLRQSRTLRGHLLTAPVDGVRIPSTLSQDKWHTLQASYNVTPILLIPDNLAIRVSGFLGLNYDIVRRPQ